MMWRIWTSRLSIKSSLSPHTPPHIKQATLQTPAPYTTTPTPYSLHPTPCTLHPTPYTPHPTPCTPHTTPAYDNSEPNTSTRNTPIRRCRACHPLKLPWHATMSRGRTRTRNLDVRLPGKGNSKLPWREAGPLNHLDDIVDSDQ